MKLLFFLILKGKNHRNDKQNDRKTLQQKSTRPIKLVKITSSILK